MYIVKKAFTDLKHQNHVYSVGDAYPCKGCEPTEARIRELSSKGNRLRIPLIALADGLGDLDDGLDEELEEDEELDGMEMPGGPKKRRGKAGKG